MSTLDVLVPCYHYGHFLDACVGSVLSQNGCDVRILIIDDASKDDSPHIARRIAAQDPRIELRIHETNQGHIATYNEGIAWASGDYFLMLSADDLLAPQCFARALSVMDAYPEICLAHGREIQFHDGDEMPLLDDSSRSSWEIKSGAEFIENSCRRGANSVGTSTAIVRTAVQKVAGGYSPALPHAADLEMWLRLATRGHVAYTDAVQAIRRVHSTNMSIPYCAQISRDYLQREAAFESFFESHGRPMPNARALRQVVRRNLSEAAYWAAVRKLQSGDVSCAWELMLMSCRVQPRNSILPPVGHLWRKRLPRRSGANVIEWSSSRNTYVRRVQHF